jgi:hypothetical protein
MRTVIETTLLALMAFFAGRGFADTITLLGWL